MSFLGIIEVAVGLAFLYLIISLLVSIINEWLAQIFSCRARNLKKAIGNLLRGSAGSGEDSLVEKFYAHPVIKALGKEKKVPVDLADPGKGTTTVIKRNPSYIAPSTFALVAFNLIFGDEDLSGKKADELMATIDKAAIHDDLKKVLKTYILSGAEKIDDLRQEVEKWFDQTMERLAGGYGRMVRWVSLFAGIAVAGILNINSIQVAGALWNDPTFRAESFNYIQAHYAEFAPPTAPADSSSKGFDTPAAKARVARIQAAMAAASFPIGWDHVKTSRLGFWGWPLMFLGWIITGLAVSLGAPFWFDILRKFVNLRSVGAAPPKPEDGK